MGTSLAPSPIASVTGEGLTPLLTRCTSSDFCNGATRHAMTTEHRSATSRNCCVRAVITYLVFLRRNRDLPDTSACTAPPAGPALICSRAWPVTINAATVPASAAARDLLSISASCSGSVGPSLYTSNTMMSISLLRTRVLKPIFLAVSNLSPVSTHSLMPASRIRTMVCWTPTCSLSSMALTPTISRPCSIFSAAAASASSRFVIAVCAARYSVRHDSNSSGRKTRRPSTNVRKPSRANSCR
mmetsp:Transcript_36705/g.110928  ORF Transcript_36705/g.110928 Transcript_36705/m.110928 type:complete len:243 (-) Transcript_36705:254-982(-)